MATTQPTNPRPGVWSRFRSWLAGLVHDRAEGAPSAPKSASSGGDAVSRVEEEQTSPTPRTNHDPPLLVPEIVERGERGLFRALDTATEPEHPPPRIEQAPAADPPRRPGVGRPPAPMVHTAVVTVAGQALVTTAAITNQTGPVTALGLLAMVTVSGMAGIVASHARHQQPHGIEARGARLLVVLGSRALAPRRGEHDGRRPSARPVGRDAAEGGGAQRPLGNTRILLPSRSDDRRWCR